MSIALRLSQNDYTPPYEQLRRQLQAMIQSGQLTTGEKLPPIRQLARDLGVAPNTVARAYKELEGAGLVATSRGGGTTVQPVATQTAPSQTTWLTASTASYIDDARKRGANDQEILAAVRAQLAGAHCP